MLPPWFPRGRRLIVWCASAALVLGGGTALWLFLHRDRLVPVSGKVTVDGRPLEQGTVTFIPNKARGNWSRSRPSASIKNGAYEVWTQGKVGAPPGWYRVVVDGFVASQRHGLRSYVLTPGDSGEAKGSWVPSPDPASHFSNYDQPLAIEVTASGDEPAYDLQLTRSRRRH